VKDGQGRGSAAFQAFLPVPVCVSRRVPGASTVHAVPAPGPAPGGEGRRPTAPQPPCRYMSYRGIPKTL